MPEIKVKHVVSFSSEDKNFQAENLVKSDGYKKWKTSKSGEKSASVTLQFEKATKIHKIDIGNESSAFVEVLVGKTGMQEDDFKVLLVASSFMNPMESRGGQNGTRVRIFTSDDLSKTAIDEKWDRVKIVCTQPFNKSVQYGLSFIKFHSPPDSNEEASTPKHKLGAFAVKDESEDDITAGSLFAQRKQKKEPVPLTGAAAVRAASKLAEESRPSTSVSSPRDDKPGPSHTTTPKRKHSPGVSEKKSEHKTPTPPVKLQKQSTSLSSVASTTSNRSKKSTPPALKRTKTEPAKPSKEKQFSQLMEKVVFVLSGFQNPYRAELRDKAMEMGAVYKPDWGKNTTHLICAFENTPKYNLVRGKGKIVKKNWLLDCYKSKKLLPWRKYRLGRARTPPGSSDESSEDEYVPVQKKTTPAKNAATKYESPKGKTKAATPGTSAQDDYGGSTDDLSGMDTEDELERIQRAKQQENKSPKKAAKQKSPDKEVATKNNKEDRDIYNVSTDEEMDIENGKAGVNSNHWDFDDLPDLFTDKNFFLYGKFSSEDRRTVVRYITAYDGSVEDYMNDKINYVITNSEWDKNFDDALADNPSIAFVKTQWIYSCHDKQKLLPHQKYTVIPK